MKQISFLKSLFFVLGLLVVRCAFSQQEPQYTQYMYNSMSVNPAYAGTRSALNALLLSRVQWVGLEGAPTSHTFAMHTPLNNRKIGVGFSVVADDIGPVRNTYVNLNYAYRLKLTSKMTLSLGVKGGIYNYHAKIGGLVPGDESFSGDYDAFYQPNAGAGAFLYSRKYYIGFSVPKLIQTNLEKEQTSRNMVSELKRHYFVIAGYVFKINNDFLLKPSILSKLVEGAPPSVDATAQVLFRNAYWLGVTYRVGDAVAFLANIKLNRQLTVGYSYDVSTSGLSTYNNGSHEIMISYDFEGFLKKKVKSPRFF